LCKVDKKSTPLKINQNIYITNDEEIKEGDWVLGDYPDNPICKVIAKISKTAGDISGKTFVLRVWTDDSRDLGTNVCSSGGITGNNSWSATSLEIDLTNCTGASCSASGCSLSASTNYHFTMDMGETDDSNYASFVRTGSSTGVGNVQGYTAAKADAYDLTSYDIQLKLHYFD
jgi:hypothetical protein